jgi:hypothetical protein
VPMLTWFCAQNHVTLVQVCPRDGGTDETDRHLLPEA